MKKILIVLMFAYLCSTNMTYAEFNDGETGRLDHELIMQQLEVMDTKELNNMIEEINQDVGELLPSLNLKEMVRGLIKGESIFSFKDIMNGMLKYIFKEVVANSMILAKLIVLAIICAFLKNLSSAFESDAVGKLAYTVCYLIIIAIAIQSFSIAIKIGIEAIDNMVMFMQAMLPILLTMLMAMGGITSAAIFQPIVIASVGVISTLMKDIILPFIFFSAILSIITYLSSKIQVSKLASFLKQVCIFLIGLMLTVFIGIITIQGVVASTTDGVTIRTAKFAVGFIPVVGGFISDATDAILGCSLLLKNAVGGIGLITLAIIVSMPLLKILSLIVIYKIASALIQPITDNQLVDCLNDMSNSLVILFATVLSVAIMFFMALTVIIGAGNMNLMMR